ncbi:hypothetical protein JOF29_005894 [Kribbella aluminosa]|uniref:Uncharacterized protein n=1 Tax=Kribbella aluminosa TaxID=416017 RepID=A0ABS4UT14_9ACTN|nr:hypothetical protein [Kribbella aluminosa]MBP2354784.1 hypothetical protein [Kribbella aluminosa]
MSMTHTGDEHLDEIFDALRRAGADLKRIVSSGRRLSQNLWSRLNRSQRQRAGIERVVNSQRFDPRVDRAMQGVDPQVRTRAAEVSSLQAAANDGDRLIRDLEAQRQEQQQRIDTLQRDVDQARNNDRDGNGIDDRIDDRTDRDRNGIDDNVDRDDRLDEQNNDANDRDGDGVDDAVERREQQGAEADAERAKREEQDRKAQSEGERGGIDPAAAAGTAAGAAVAAEELNDLQDEREQADKADDQQQAAPDSDLDAAPNTTDPDRDPALDPNDPANASALDANDPSLDQNAPAVDATDPSLDLNNPALDANESGVDGNDPSLDTNDRANAPAVDANDPALDPNDPSNPYVTDNPELDTPTAEADNPQQNADLESADDLSNSGPEPTTNPDLGPEQNGPDPYATDTSVDNNLQDGPDQAGTDPYVTDTARDTDLAQDEADPGQDPQTPNGPNPEQTLQADTQQAPAQQPQAQQVDAQATEQGQAQQQAPEQGQQADAQPAQQAQQTTAPEQGQQVPTPNAPNAPNAQQIGNAANTAVNETAGLGDEGPADQGQSQGGQAQSQWRPPEQAPENKAIDAAREGNQIPPGRDFSSDEKAALTKVTGDTAAAHEAVSSSPAAGDGGRSTRDIQQSRGDRDRGRDNDGPGLSR